jgi:8-oxo-dGTP pyrophosphatase MutT (NUDIX family)
MRPKAETMTEIIQRRAIRAFVLTPQHEVLLMRIRAPQGGDPFWIAPGGGMEPDESEEAALKRELAEELGLLAFEVGPMLWRRHHTFNWGPRRLSQRESYRAVHVDRFEPVMSDPQEAKVLECFRWWRIGDLARSGERVTPRLLASIVDSYLTLGAPDPLPDEEVLID